PATEDPWAGADRLDEEHPGEGRLGSQRGQVVADRRPHHLGRRLPRPEALQQVPMDQLDAGVGVEKGRLLAVVELVERAAADARPRDDVGHTRGGVPLLGHRLRDGAQDPAALGAGDVLPRQSVWMARQSLRRRPREARGKARSLARGARRWTDRAHRARVTRNTSVRHYLPGGLPVGSSDIYATPVDTTTRWDLPAAGETTFTWEYDDGRARL